MTLGGLGLAVGILVDDATVEIENIHRNLGLGKEIEPAILDGAAQIAVPAFVSTLSICIVFVPVVFLSGAGGHDKDAAAGRGDGEVRLRPELAPEPRHEAELVGLRGSEHQRIEAEHSGLVAVGVAAGFQHVGDAGVQGRQEVVVAFRAQALWQGHLQQVAAWMGAEPGLQFGVDAVHEAEPGALVDAAAGLGRHRVADDFRFGAVARDQQVERGAILQRRELHCEAAGALHGGGAEQVKGRDQALVAGGGEPQLFQQRFAAGGVQVRQRLDGLGGIRGDALLGDARRPGRRLAAQALDGELDTMALQDVASGPGLLHAGLGQGSQAVTPERRAHGLYESVQGLRIDHRRSRLHQWRKMHARAGAPGFCARCRSK